MIMTLDVINIQGKKTGRTVDLPESIFGIAPNEHVLYLSAKAYLANQRQGTHKSKERGEVSKSTRKIKKQKGTGGARAGSMKNPLFKGGGRIFGPKPRDYTQKLNKKVRDLARKSAFSAKLSDGNLTILEDFTLDQPKTQEFANVLANLELKGTKSLFLTADYDKNLYLSSRNVPDSRVLHARDANPYEIMYASKVIVMENALKVIQELHN
jgi:large subunit ribosomal protein L4